jgi:hypothetical protein
MTKLEELEKATHGLPEEEYRQFRYWFLEEDWERWDRQIAENSRAGKLDFLRTYFTQPATKVIMP